MITASQLLLELSTWVHNSPEDLESVKNITTENSSELIELIDMWSNGQYDEDPELLVQEILNLRS